MKVLALVLCLVALAAGGRGPTPEASTEALTVPTPVAVRSVSRAATGSGHVSRPERARVPFCLPGEKVVCTLGPPPVCHCE